MANKKEIPIIFHKTRTDAVRAYEKEQVRILLESLGNKLHTNAPIRRIEVGINYQKNREGQVKSFEVTLSLELASGPRFVSHGKSNIAKAKGVGLSSGIREAFSDIEAQYLKMKRVHPGN